MAWAGGTFTRTNGTYSGSTVWQSDAAAAVKIRADRHDTHDQDLAAGINNCLAKDGQNSPSQNIGWGGFKITSLGNGTVASDAATYGQTATAAAWNGSGTLTLTRAAGNITATLGAADVTAALTYTPVNKAGDTMTGVLAHDGGDVRQSYRNGDGSPTKRATVNFGTGGLDAQGYYSIQRRDTSDGFEAVLMGLRLTTGTMDLAGGITLGGGFTVSKFTLSNSAPGALAQGEVFFRY